MRLSLKQGEGRARTSLCLSLPPLHPHVSCERIKQGGGEARGSEERGDNFLKSGLEGHLVIACDDIKNNNHVCQDRAHSMPGSGLAGRQDSSHCLRQLSRGVASNEVC